LLVVDLTAENEIRSSLKKPPSKGEGLFRLFK
jgi:hypothetical protein